MVLRPGNPGGHAITDRRGLRKYFLVAEGTPLRLGKAASSPEVLLWAAQKTEALAKLTNRREKIALSAVNIATDAYPMLLPHRVRITLLSSFATIRDGDRLEKEMKSVLGRGKVKWSLECVANRPPMRTKKRGNTQIGSMQDIARQWEIPFVLESSVMPSAAGLIKQGTPVLCGMGPCARDLYTSRECIERVSLVQRTLLLSQYLASKLKDTKNA
jgi:D-alanine-D-alanine ligase